MFDSFAEKMPSIEQIEAELAGDMANMGEYNND